MRQAALALCALLGACAGTPRIADLNPVPGSIELAAVPFFPQEKFQCGPAALATALAATGIAVTPDELTPRIFLPGRHGSLQAEIVSASRSYGRVPYRLMPGMEDLLAEVAAGNPVLVLQNLGLSSWPAWHYAVVIGYDGAGDVLILRSGTTQRKLESLRDFQKRWGLADHWALVLVPPDRLPATARMIPWLHASVAFEELEKPKLAEAAYIAAATRWPDEPLPWQLLGNARYGAGDLVGAEQALRTAARMRPDPATLNNLSQVLLDRGCPGPALSMLSLALAIEAPPETVAMLKRTRAGIDAWRGTPSLECPR